jgi:hypothetical protein
MKVAVYYNLHKKTFSLQSRNKEDYGKVIKHTDHVILKNSKFVVREAGRQKVLKEQCKNVHAFVVGETVDSVGAESGPSLDVSYNPYLGGSFYVKATKAPASEALYTVLKMSLKGTPEIKAYTINGEVNKRELPDC